MFVFPVQLVPFARLVSTVSMDQVAQQDVPKPAYHVLARIHATAARMDIMDTTATRGVQKRVGLVKIQVIVYHAKMGILDVIAATGAQ